MDPTLTDAEVRSDMAYMPRQMNIDLLREFTELPPTGRPAAELTDRDKVALALAAGLPYVVDMAGTMLTVRIAEPFGVADRGDGGYFVACASSMHARIIRCRREVYAEGEDRPIIAL